MKLNSQRSQWDLLGRTDPLWAILTDPERRGGKWDEAEFFATGEREIAEVMERARSFGVPAARAAALDFGCGVGRVTQALAGHFDQVTGVDISPAMLERAGAYNRYGARCRYLLNDRCDLGGLDDAAFDLVYSRIVLQHLPPRHIRAYLGELMRVLCHGGLLVFQLPDRYHRWREALVRRLYQAVARKILRKPDVMEMYGLPKSEVVALLEGHGARVLAVEEDAIAGAEWLSWRYYATRS